MLTRRACLLSCWVLNHICTCQFAGGGAEIETTLAPSATSCDATSLIQRSVAIAKHTVVTKHAVHFIKTPAPQKIAAMHPDTNGMVLGHVSDPGKHDTKVAIYCYPSSVDQWVSGSILENGAWESELVASAARPWITNPDLRGNFLDVGANIGTYTLPLGHFLQGKGEVISVEAMPDIAEHLKAGIVANSLSNVNLFQYAVGEADAENHLVMNFDPKNKGASSVAGNAKVLKGGKEVEVGMTTLDAMLVALPALKSVVSMKVDIEGNEGRLLKGAHEFFTKHPPCYLLMELKHELLENAGTPFEEVIHSLTNFGYRKAQDEKFNNHDMGHFEQTDMASCLKRFA